MTTEEPHGHVVSVATAGPRGSAPWHWPLAELLGALDAGESFYTLSGPTGEREEFEAVPCPVAGCGVTTIAAETGDGHDTLRRLAENG